MEILNQGIITAAEAKEILEKRDVDSMTYEQKICVDFMKKNIKVSAKDAKEMFEELKALDVPEDTSISIINTMPKTVEAIKMVFPRERSVPSDEELEKINEIVRKHE